MKNTGVQVSLSTIQQGQQPRRSTRLVVRNGNWKLKQSPETGELIPERVLSLLDLPVEIRSIILSYLLCQEKTLHSDRSGHHRPSYDKNGRHHWLLKSSGRFYNFQFHPAVLRVNRQLYEEGRPLLYYDNFIDIEVHPYSICVFDHDHNIDGRQGSSEYKASVRFLERFPSLSIKIVLTKRGFRSDLKYKVNELVSIINEHTPASLPPRNLSIEFIDLNLALGGFLLSPFCTCEDQDFQECQCPTQQRKSSLTHAAAVLSPLRRLININSVNISGLVPAKTKEALIPAILSADNKPLDLEPMYDATAQFILSLPNSRYIEGLIKIIHEEQDREPHDRGRSIKKHRAYHAAVAEELSIAYSIDGDREDDDSDTAECAKWIEPGLRALRQAKDRDDTEAFVKLRAMLLWYARTMWITFSHLLPFHSDPDSRYVPEAGEDDEKDEDEEGHEDEEDWGENDTSTEKDESERETAH